MDPARWRKIEDLFHQASDVPATSRSAWLAEACKGDESLLAEVESLLASEEAAGVSIADNVANAVRETAGELDYATLPRMLGPYRLLKVLGRGGMGTVYLAERADGQFEKKVAVKMVQPGMDTEFILARFRRERQVLAHFDHPNIGRLLDGGTAQGNIPYLVMEYIDGDWITRYCATNQLSIEQRLELFLKICSAVQYAHRRFVVHRDIKPGNILVDPDGQPRLLDFGICKLLYREGEESRTGTHGMRLMTPDYASPEQVRGDPVSATSDVYALGAVLYELLTGAKPHLFPKLTPQVVEQVVCEQDVIAPSQIVREKNPKLALRLESDLDNIILHAMRKEPERRYETVEQFAEDIQRHLRDLPVRARPDTWIYRSRKFARRNRVSIAGVAAFVLAFAAGILIPRLQRTALPGSTASAPTDPKRIELLLELGDSYAQEKNWEQALGAYQQASMQLDKESGIHDAQHAKWRYRLQEQMGKLQKQQELPKNEPPQEKVGKP